MTDHKDADSLYFFQINLPYHFIRNNLDETKEDVYGVITGSWRIYER